MHAAAMTWLVEDVQKISALNQLKGKILEAKRVPPPPMFESMSADKLSLPQSPMSRRTSSSSKRQNGLCHHQGDQCDGGRGLVDLIVGRRTLRSQAERN